MVTSQARLDVVKDSIEAPHQAPITRPEFLKLTPKVQVRKWVRIDRPAQESFIKPPSDEVPRERPKIEFQRPNLRKEEGCAAMKSLHSPYHRRWLNPNPAGHHELSELELPGAWELPASSRTFGYSERQRTQLGFLNGNQDKSFLSREIEV